MSEETSDKGTLLPQEIISVFGTSAPGGDTQINSIKTPRTVATTFYCSGDAYVKGYFKTPIRPSRGLYFNDGSENEPSITFENDTDTGIYRESDGTMGFTSNGSKILGVGNEIVVNGEITTDSGNLILNPAGPSIDFTGHTLLGVGGITVRVGNPNEVIVNDNNGDLTSETYLSTVRGGVGRDTSALSGIAKVTAGNWNFTQVTNADISNSAAINRTKIGTGTANYVVVNDISGNLTEEQRLSTVRGGTGTNSSSATGIAKVTAGTWTYSPIVNADISGSAAISRTKLAQSTANTVVINDSLGDISQEAQLSTVRGGTGTDSSAATGVAKVSSGSWSYSGIVNSDISSSANIVRSKIAAGTADRVLINDGTGRISEEAQLSTIRGGTGQNTSSSTGIAKVNAGTWSVSSIVDSDISLLAGIDRGKLSATNANYVLINDGTGIISEEAQLSTIRGGTGQNTSSSTGIAKVNTGTWSFSQIANADISNTADISRSKIVSGSADYVLINDGTGRISEEAQLSTARGGTGTNSSTSTGVAKVNAGSWSYSSIVNSDISSSANIVRSKIAAGTADRVLINDGTGRISEEAQLSTIRGGTGTDSSAATGVAKVSSGSWSYSNIDNSDVSSSANIARTKLAAGNAGRVLINDGTGRISEEAQLSTTRGGTGTDTSSATGVAKVNNGTWSVSALTDTDFGTINSLTVGTLTATEITSTADMIIAPTGDTFITGTTIQQHPSGLVQNVTYMCDATTVGATTADIFAFPMSGIDRASFAIKATISLFQSTGTKNAGIYTFICKADPLNGISSLIQLGSILDGGLTATLVDSYTSLTNDAIIRVTGIAGETVKWGAKVEVTSCTE